MSDRATALALATRPAAGDLTYLRVATVNPISIAALAIALAVAFGHLGFSGSLFALAFWLSACIGASRVDRVRAEIDRHLASREADRREASRVALLKTIGPVRQQQYRELRELVERIEATDPREAARFEVQDLLDLFVRFAAWHQQYGNALVLAEASPLAAPATDLERARRAREIFARRQRHRDGCRQRVEELAGELDAIDQLVRLIAQRVACPAVDDDFDREIQRRLWELDEVDQALAQLSA